MMKIPGLLRAAALLATTLGASAVLAAQLNVAIHQSPWLDGFRKTAALYEKETGNKLSLTITPYAGLLEKERNSLRSPRGQFDLVMLDSHWLAEIYAGGFLVPIHKLEANFRLDPAVMDFDQTIYWNKTRLSFSKEGGELMGLPITGNVQLFYYRSDQYLVNGIKPPQTWDDVRAASAKLKGKTDYPFVIWGQRDGVLFRAMPFMLSAGGGIFKNPRQGEYDIIVNTPQTLAGLKAYIEFARSSHPSPGNLTLSDISQLVSTGKTAQTMEVAAMWAAVNNKDSSIAAGHLGVVPVPRMPGGKAVNAAGHWVGGIAANVSPEQQKLALSFMNWLLKKSSQVAYFENGSIPVRGDLVGSAKDPYGVLPALSEAIKSAVLITPVKDGAQVYRILGVHINQALVGEKSPEQALNDGAKEVYELMRNGGYKTSLPKDL